MEKLKNGRIKKIVQIQLLISIVVFSVITYRSKTGEDVQILIQSLFLSFIALSSIENFLLKKTTLAVILGLITIAMGTLIFQAH